MSLSAIVHQVNNRIDVENKMKFPSGNAEVTVGSNTKPQ